MLTSAIARLNVNALENKTGALIEDIIHDVTLLNSYLFLENPKNERLDDANIDGVNKENIHSNVLRLIFC